MILKITNNLSDIVNSITSFAGGGWVSRPAESASGKNDRKRPSEKRSDGIAEVWGGGGEPSGQKRQSKKWLSLMALRKFGEAGQGGGGRGADWPKTPVGKTAESAHRKKGPMALRKFGGAESQPAKNASQKNVQVRWHCRSATAKKSAVPS